MDQEYEEIINSLTIAVKNHWITQEDTTEPFYLEYLRAEPELLKGIYFLMHSHSYYTENKERLRTYQSTIHKTKWQIDMSALNKLKWFFTSKTNKQEMIEAVSDIEEYVIEMKPLMAYTKQQLDKIEEEVSKEEIDNHFTQNVHAYYMKLEALGIQDGLPLPESAFYLKQAAKMKEGIEQLLDFEKDLTDSLPEKTKQVQHSLAHKAYEETDIEKFAKMYPGMNTTILKRNNVETVGELETALERYKPFVNRVYDSRRILESSLTNYLDHLEEHVPFRFSSSHPTNEELNLLYSLYLIYTCRPLLKEISEMNDEYVEDIESLVKEMTDKQPWKRDFIESTGENEVTWKEQTQTVRTYVEKHLTRFSAIQSAIDDFKETTFKDVWEDYLVHSANYYALLDEYELVASSDASEYSDLAQEIIDKVKAIDLKKQYLTASLRGWQTFGAKYALAQKKTLLGDEMGLGKTVQAIAMMAHLYEEGARHFLVICPASILINWSREISKHSLLESYILHGNQREDYLEDWMKNGGIAITTYATASKLPFEKLSTIDALVVDEAHYVKNPGAKRSQAVYDLNKKCNYIMYMSGTPLENKLNEMESLIRQLQPEVIETFEENPIYYSDEFFKEAISPVYLRRNKEDVLTELPDLMQIEEVEEFSDKEKGIYKHAVAEGKFMLMRRVAWMDKKGSNKLKRLVEIYEEAQVNGKKVLIFSFFRDVIQTIYHKVEDHAMIPITGAISANQRQDIVDEFTHSKNKNILIAQIQAGGVGLNIQAASIVIFCEPQIKPALETQAVARSLRMGQTQTVFAYRLLTENSIDEAMMEMLQNKQQLFDTYAKDSFISEASESARDISEETVVKTIIEHERKRLNIQSYEEEEGFVDY